MLGLILLVVGYRSNNRNTLAAAALVLLIAGMGLQAAEGFRAGVLGIPAAGGA